MTQAPQFDVVAIGNAIVDVLASADDDFLDAEAMVKGGMRLISAEEARALYGKMGPAREISGGSGANTIAGLASLGRRCGFVGQVADDQFGRIFSHDVRALGVTFDVPAMGAEPPTAQCLIFVTPDGQRTMNTYLGASQNLAPDAVDPALIEGAAILYLEGYLWNADASREAMRKAIGIAHAAGRKVALTLSDIFVITGHGAEFLAMCDAGEIDILFANDAEVRALMAMEDVGEAVAALAARVPLLVCTHGPKGAEAHRDGESARIAAEPIDELVDTTGAGDLFASGFLAGLTEGRPLETCLRMGAICAAECIQHWGPRPEAELKALVDRTLAGS